MSNTLGALSIFTPLGWAKYRFQSERADYYEYLGGLLKSTQGQLNLIDIFEKDSIRYEGSARGTLSRHWYDMMLSTGKLSLCWEGTMPHEDVAILAAAELVGGEALAEVITDLAHQTELIEDAKSQFVLTVAYGLIGIAIAFASLAMIPFFGAPKISSLVSFADVSLYTKAVTDYFEWAKLISGWWWLGLLGVIVLVWGVAWSLTNFIGPGRRRLDRFFVWKLYRDFQGLKFLAALSMTIKRRREVNSSTNLKDALVLLRSGANVYMDWHIGQMLEHLDSGAQAIHALDTGLLDKGVYWWLADLEESLGLDQGLQKTGQRIETKFLSSVTRRSVWVRWSLLSVGLAVTLWATASTIRALYDVPTIAKAYYSQ